MAHEEYDDLLAHLEGHDDIADDSGTTLIPEGVVAYVQTIARSPWVIEQVLDLATSRVMRRLRKDTVGARRAKWEARWRPEQQARTKRMLGRLRDEVVRVHHCGNVAAHTTFTEMPGWMRRWRPGKAGILVVDEPALLKPSIGSPGFLEPTPAKVLRWVHETWQSKQHHGELDFDQLPRTPKVWDLTAGSGSGRDYFGLLHGSLIVSSDLTVVPGEGVALADCRQVGLLAQHREQRRAALVRPDLAIPRPDIVLFDPPSPGMPTCSLLYGDGEHPDDLAALDREPWIFAVADVVVRAARHLADGGLLSLLLRTGRRAHQGVEPDDAIVDDLRVVLDGRVTILHEMPVAYRRRHAQTSLGLNRVPTVHLTVGSP